MPTNPSSILALDVGDKRIGVAVASEVARLPRPLTTLPRTDDFLDKLRDIIEDERVRVLVIGLPRGLDGQQTEQTAVTEKFIEELDKALDLPVRRQDEALTSQKAENELTGKRSKAATGDVDSLAATYILEDYLAEHPAPSEVA